MDAQAREEDRRKAEAALALARAWLAEARAYLEKACLRAPLSGMMRRGSWARQDERVKGQKRKAEGVRQLKYGH